MVRLPGTGANLLGSTHFRASPGGTRTHIPATVSSLALPLRHQAHTRLIIQSYCCMVGKCVIYARISTEKQEDGVSLDSQEERCRKYAEYKGLEVKQVFREVKSGKSLSKRRKLLEALEMLQKGDTLVVAALSRLARNTKETFQIVDKLEQKGCFLVSITEDYDTKTPIGKLVFTILAALSEMESSQTSERVKAGIRHKKDHGEDLGRPPYGKMYVNKVLVQNPKEMEIIRWMYDCSRDGWSLNQIAQQAHAMGYQPKGKKWHASTISRILNSYEQDMPVDSE